VNYELSKLYLGTRQKIRNSGAHSSWQILTNISKRFSPPSKSSINTFVRTLNSWKSRKVELLFVTTF